MLAQLKDVTKRYRSVTALSNVSFSVGRGEVVAVLGPNGAGKTTAIRLLLGLSRPTTGEANLFGTRIGAMLQSASLPETLRVNELIELFSSYHPGPLPATEVVKAAGLGGLESRLFGKLSGGQKQRVMMALALCGDPELLFLDEPTAGLDTDARRLVWAGVRNFVARGRSVLLTTHYLEEAEALAHRVVLLRGGRIIAEGSPVEIKSRTASERLEDAYIELMKEVRS
jgi:ABC-2 type transport system ATP-binding protein